MPRVRKQQETPEVEQVLERPMSESGTVLVELPVGDVPQTSFRLHIQCHLSAESSIALRRIADAYDKQQARLSNGTRVVNATTAIRKIIEDIAASIDS